MAVGLGGALLGRGEGEKEMPAQTQSDQQPQIMQEETPTEQPRQSRWALGLGGLIPKADSMRAFMQLPTNTVPWNIEATRLDLLKKLCAQNGLGRQGELQDLEHRLTSGLHWNTAMLQSQLQTLYLKQVKAGGMIRMRLGVAALTEATTSAADMLQMPQIFTPAKQPDQFDGHRDALLRRLNVRHGLPETGNTKMLTFRLQRNLGWDEEQLQAKLEIEWHIQQKNTWVPTPKGGQTDEVQEHTEAPTEEKTEEKTDESIHTQLQTGEAEDSHWEYLKSSPSSSISSTPKSSATDDSLMEQKESEKMWEGAREAVPTTAVSGDKTDMATEPSKLRHRDLERTFSNVSECASDSSYEVVDN